MRTHSRLEVLRCEVSKVPIDVLTPQSGRTEKVAHHKFAAFGSLKELFLI
jgi:hypothetical protein